MVLLESDPFLTELTKLYERNKAKGTVWITMKRTALRKKPKKDAAEGTADGSGGDVCLVRATDGKKKISTRISAKDHVRFQAAFSLVLKAHMDSLKRREKKDKKKPAK